MKLIIGLGNPEEKYSRNRHNAGKIIVLAMGRIEGYSIEISDQFMNNSGGFVKQKVHEYGVELDNLIVIHDDWAFDIGAYKMQFNRGPNGHNGVESIINALGSQQFWRIRIGIGGVPEGTDGSDYVLSNFTESEISELEFVANDVKRTLIDYSLKSEA